MMCIVAVNDDSAWRTVVQRAVQLNTLTETKNVMHMCVIKCMCVLRCKGCMRKLRAVLKRAIYVQCHYYCRKVPKVSKRVCNAQCIGLGLTAGADIDPMWDLTSVEKVTQDHSRKRMGQV